MISEILYLKSNIRTKDFIILFNISIFYNIKQNYNVFCIFITICFLRKINFREILKNFKTYFAIVLGSLWILKNILISGCLIYPIAFTCINNLSWTNLEKVKEISLENEAFTKNWPNYEQRHINSQSFYVSNFNWVKTWVKAQKSTKEILLLYVLFLILVYVYVHFKSEPNGWQLDKNYKLIFIILTLALFCGLQKYQPTDMVIQ